MSLQLVYRAWQESDDALIAAFDLVQISVDRDNRLTPLPRSVRVEVVASVCPDFPKLRRRDYASRVFGRG